MKLESAALAGLRKGQLPSAEDGAALLDAVGELADSVRVRREVDAGVLRLAGKALSGGRHFTLVRQLAQAWRDAQQPLDLTLQRLHAQAEINLSALDAGEALVDEGLKCVDVERSGDPNAVKEGAELRGLRGRVAKQRFVDHGDPRHLGEALDRYLEAMAKAPVPVRIWPAVNALALLHRRDREMLAPGGPVVDADALAQEIERYAKAGLRRNPDDPWLAATMSECRLAQNRADSSELWLHRFMQHPQIDAFSLDSYDRQLREIWGGRQGRSETLADRLETLMARHLLRQQSRWSVAPSAVPELRAQLARDPQGFEKNFSDEYGFSLESLERLLVCCASIGCVSNHRGERLGTGFLLAGDELKAGWGSTPVFVTNAHVISSEFQRAIAPDQVRVSFEVESAQAAKPRFYGVEEVLYTSSPAPLGQQLNQKESLDVTVVRLKELSPSLKSLARAIALPLIETGTKAYIVGHPRGSGLQISLHDSQLLDICNVERLLHYRTPTEPGSSGSPVLNAQWKVIAVHHGGSATMPRLNGGGTYQANEGISLLALRAALAQ